MKETKSGNKSETKLEKENEAKRLLVLKNEILMSEEIIKDKVVPQMEEAISRYTGTHTPPYSMDIVLNEIYPIIQYELPAIFFKTPRAFLKPRSKNYIVKKYDPIQEKKVDTIIDANKSAKTQEHILNYSLDLMKYKEQNRKTLMDALLFKYGVLWHGYKGDFGMTEEQSLYIVDEKVFVKHVRPDKIIFDPKVSLSEISEADWVGRVIDIPLRDIVEDDKLDVDPNIKGKDGFGVVLDKDNPLLNKQGVDIYHLAKNPKTLLSKTDEEFRKHAQYITVYEVFVKPTKKEKRAGSNGWVYLLTDAQKKPLRKKPWPYKTDAWPLKILMFNEVPTKTFGMSDIEVFGDIADHKNLVINMQLRNAESNAKSVTIFDRSGMDEDTIQKLESGEQNIVGVDGSANGKLAMVSPGGSASSELYLLDGRIQSNLDEKSGVNDLKKGSLRSGEESATSVQIRNAGSSARPAYRQDLMSDFLKDSFKFINDLNQQFMPIKDAVRITGSLDIEWSDKPSKEEVQADVDVEIDVISMLPESPEREMQANQMVLSMMTDAMTNPQIIAKLAQEGKTFNLSPVIDQLLYRLKIRDPEVFRNLRPEETQGFAPVAELRAAEANVMAALSGQPLPSPPDKGQNHQTRIAAYQSQQNVLKLQGQVSEILDQLIQLQMQVAELETKEKAPRSGTQLKKPSVEVV